MGRAGPTRGRHAGRPGFDRQAGAVYASRCWCGVSFAGRPIFTPRATARARPRLMRWAEAQLSLVVKSRQIIETIKMTDGFDTHAIKRKLERLRKTRKLGAYRAFLLESWPGMRNDIRTVCEEMAFELRKNGKVSPFLKSFRIEGDNITFELPNWWHESRARFAELYDPPEDDVRFEKASTTLQERFFRQFEGRSDLALQDLTDMLEAFFEQEEVPTGIG